MPWLQLTIETDAEHAEDLAEFLQLFGANAVSFSAANDEKIFDNVTDQTRSLWQSTSVSGLLPHDVDLDILLVCLRDRIGADFIFDRKIELIEDQDWVGDYQKSQPLLWYREKLCICPSWTEPPDTTVAPLILDPGLAFGTGTHATTRLCVEWLVDHDIQDKTVIDYGCGSGILALAAARLGAGAVYAVDIDQQAVTAAEDNIQRNDLTQQISVGLCGELQLPQCDIVVANVLLNPLLELVEKFSTLIPSNGQLVLSGLLATQIEECLAAYTQWFTMGEPVLQQEWALLQGTRK